MTSSPSNISQQIVAQAKFLGASLAGIADAKLLKQSPSHFIYPRMEHQLAVGSRELAEGIELGKVAWPANAKSVVVVAAEHKKDTPELDWWDGQTGTPGIRLRAMILEAEVEPTGPIQFDRLNFMLLYQIKQTS